MARSVGLSGPGALSLSLPRPTASGVYHSRPGVLVLMPVLVGNALTVGAVTGYAVAGEIGGTG